METPGAAGVTRCINQIFGIVLLKLGKGQAGMFALQGGIVGEARIVERAFDLGPCALTEAVALLQDRLANAET